MKTVLLLLADGFEPSENIVTSTAPGTAFDVALTLVEMLTSPENAAEIRRLMGLSVT
jgi:4-methyl-5(b-hydroxyethyl)-thiazole monophosphate biosynthesis